MRRGYGLIHAGSKPAVLPFRAPSALQPGRFPSRGCPSLTPRPATGSAALPFQQGRTHPLPLPGSLLRRLRPQGTVAPWLDPPFVRNGTRSLFSQGGTPSWAFTPPAALAGLAPSLCRPFRPPDLLPGLGSFPPTKCHSSGYSHLLGTTLRQATHTGSGRPFGLYRDCSTCLGLPGPPNRLAPGRRRGPYTL